MARADRVEFEMNSILQFKSVIRGHHVYREIWAPVKDETVLCMEDERGEAKSFDKYAVGSCSANVFAKVKGKRKREIGLVVPALYMATADTSENGKRVVKILADEIKKKNERYPHFDVIITDDYMSRPVVNEIVKDIVI